MGSEYAYGRSHIPHAEGMVTKKEGTESIASSPGYLLLSPVFCFYFFIGDRGEVDISQHVKT